MGNMLAYTVVSAFILALLLPFLAWGFTRVLDRINGRSFREVLEIILLDPLAAAVYYGLRWGFAFLGMAIVISRVAI